MKRTQLLVAAMGLAVATHAQRPVGTSSSIETPVEFLQKAATDTIAAGGLAGGVALLGAQNGGYVAGVNGYGDLSKAQEFQLTSGTIVEEVLFWFGAMDLQSNDPNSVITARLYALDGPGTNAAGATNGAPGTIYGEVTIPVAQVDTGSSLTFTAAQFTTPVWVPSGFAAGVSFENTSGGDTLGLVHSVANSVGAPNRSWEEWSDNTWYTFSSTSGWGLQVDLAIFVAIDASSVGIGEAGSFNGMRMSFLNGNPAATDDVLIGFEVENTSRMEFVVHNAKGEQLLVQDLGQRGLGVQQVSFSTAGWADGVYYCTLKADGRPLTKKLVVRR